MKNLLLTLSLFSMLTFSCKKEETQPTPPAPEPPPAMGPITLGCSYNNGLTLTNHNKVGSGVDYIVNCDCEIIGGKLAIDTNVTIQFSPEASLKVKDNAYIEAKGTASKTIVFEGQSNVSASWRGLFIESNDPRNSMDYCIVRNGGNKDYTAYIGTSSYQTRANIWVSGNFKLSNSLVTGSGGEGLYLYEEATLLTFSNNVVSNNARAPIMLYCGDLANLGVATSTFSGNTDNYIGLYSVSSNEEVAESVIFNKANAPYMLLNSHYFQNNLTVNPGVTLKSKASKSFGIQGTGFIKMIGTASETITLTGETNIAGFWNGLVIGTTNPLNEIDFITISGGGNSVPHYQVPNSGKGNIAVGYPAVGPAFLKLGSNTSSTNSSGCVLALSAGNSTVTNNSGLLLTVPCTY